MRDIVGRAIKEFLRAGGASPVAGDALTYNTVEPVWAAIAGGAGATWTTIEQNLGSTPTTNGKFTLVDAAISGASKVIIVQAPGPYTGKGTRADEAEMDSILAIAEPGSGQAIVKWRVVGFVSVHPVNMQGGNFDSRPDSLVLPASAGWGRLKSSVVGKVKGNVKFTYTVA